MTFSADGGYLSVLRTEGKASPSSRASKGPPGVEAPKALCVTSDRAQPGERRGQREHDRGRMTADGLEHLPLRDAQRQDHRREPRGRRGAEHPDRLARVAVEGRAGEHQSQSRGEEGDGGEVPGRLDHRQRHLRAAEAGARQLGRRQLPHHERLACTAVDGRGEEGERSGYYQCCVHSETSRDLIHTAAYHTVVYRWVAEMAAPTRTTRDSWIDAGLRALAAGGPEAVRVEALAKALDVTKGGFYWQFEDRGALLDTMLEAWERAGVDEVIDRLEAAGGDARAKLRHLFEIATTETGDLMQIELAVRDWGRRDKTVARRLRRVDNRRMEYMRALFRDLGLDDDEVEARCTLAFSLWIGNHFMAADHGSRSRAEVLELARRWLEAGPRG